MNRLAAAIDIGGTFTKLAVVDSEGNPKHFRRIETVGPANSFLTALKTEVARLLDLESNVTGIGISVAGFINPEHSAMIYNPNIAWLENVPLLQEISEAFPYLVQLDCDSNAAAIGEFQFGQKAAHPRFLLLTVGTGIGGGMVIDNQLLRFTYECLGDVGHIIVVPGGPRCPCGGLGCAEAVAAAPALLQAGQVASLAQVPDELFAAAGRHLGVLLASLSSVFFPSCIAVGGGVAQASPVYLEYAFLTFRASAPEALRHTTAVVPAVLGSHASLVGAVCPILQTKSR